MRTREPENIYLRLTHELNAGRLRAILSGGQAVVLHRLALMSKDGDWILREEEECMRHVLSVLEGHGAVYRFGAPLDIRWLSAGWSSHLEFRYQDLRVRTDFVTRPARLSSDRLASLWREQENRSPPFLGVTDLIETKKTNREKDYAVIGELARLITNVEERLRHSRSARELIELAGQHPDKMDGLKNLRPALASISAGLDALEAALDAERRRLMHANEHRLSLYMAAADAWGGAWPGLSRVMEGKSLSVAHQDMVDRAQGLLPTAVPGGWP